MSRYKCIQRVGANRQTSLEKILDSIRRYPGAWDGVALFTPANFNDTPEESQRKYEAFEPQVRAIQALCLPVQFNIGKFRLLWINQLLLFGAFENVNYGSASAAYLLSNDGIAEALLVKCQLYWFPCQDHKRKNYREHWCAVLSQLHAHAAPFTEKQAL